MSQHMEALATANEVRCAIASVKRELRSLPLNEGLLRCAEILERPPEDLMSMRLAALLQAVRRFGSAKVNLLLDSLGIRSGVREWRLRDIDQGQREFLAAALRERVERTRGRRA